MREFEVRQVEDHVIHVVGDLDVLTSPRLRAAITDLVVDGGGDVVVDMSEVSFMDSSAIHVLLNAAWSLGDRRTLVIRHPSQQVARVLEVTGLTPRPDQLPMAIDWGDRPMRDGPGAVHRLVAATNASLDASRRSAALTRDAEALVRAARAVRAVARANRTARGRSPAAA